ncbi:MAG TPA: hypothetical protein VJI66_00405 [Candidatus Paceibacterota bacterium]
MKDALILEGKNYISARRAASEAGYASDYIGQLCRAGKLECKMVGRSWFVTLESLLKHKASINPTIEPTIESAIIPITIPVATPLQVATVSVPEPAPIAISFVPHTFALPYFISPSFLTSPTYERPSRIISTPLADVFMTAGVLVVSLVFLFNAISPTKIIDPRDLRTASVISAAENLAYEIISFFSDIPKYAKNVFNNNNSVVVKGDEPSDDYNGLAVVPSTNSPEKDEIIKQKIKESFSDEVRVKPDETGTSGVITPVFKKVKGEDFIYVLVPIQESSQENE